MTCGQWSNISRWLCVILYTHYLKPGHLNVNLLNIAISQSLHLQSLHHNPHFHQHQHQGDLMLGWSLNFFCDLNTDLLRSFIVNKECRFLCHLLDMFNVKLTQQLKLGTFSIDKGQGSKNVTFKMDWRLFQLSRIYFSSLKIANVGQFPWSWFLWDCTQV